MKAVVYANKGARTREMSLEEATVYARQLEHLGNYDVRVEVIHP